MAPPLLNSAGSSARPSLRATKPAVSSPHSRVPAAHTRRHSRGATLSVSAVAAAPVLQTERPSSSVVQLLEPIPVQLQQQTAPQGFVSEDSAQLVLPKIEVASVAEHEVANSVLPASQQVSGAAVVSKVPAASVAPVVEASTKALDAAAAPWTPPSTSSALSAVSSETSSSAVAQTEADVVDITPPGSTERAHEHVSVMNAAPAMSVLSLETASTLHRQNTGEHNSVVIKEDSMVKNAAGAISKVLDRILCMYVTAVKRNASHESLNRTVKAMAVARKYIKDVQPEMELAFLPLNRRDQNDVVDMQRFGFLVFKTTITDTLLDHDETDLNISRSSEPRMIANAVIRIVLERGQVVMKAGGADAIFVAMTAVINARRRLKRKHGTDVMLVPAWITEDTVSTLGRESKFLRFNLIKCAPNGPVQSTVWPRQGSLEGAGAALTSPAF